SSVNGICLCGCSHLSSAWWSPQNDAGKISIVSRESAKYSTGTQHTFLPHKVLPGYKIVSGGGVKNCWKFVVGSIGNSEYLEVFIQYFNVSLICSALGTFWPHSLR